MGLLSRLRENAGERIEDFDTQTQRYRAGEISAPEQMLQGAANAVGLFADVPGELLMSGLDAVVPEIIQSGFRDIIAGAMDTDAAKTAIQIAQENPRAAKSAGYAGELLLEFIGAGQAPKAAKEVVDSIARNAPNKLEGFYGSGNAGQILALGKGGPSTILHSTNELLNPKAQARLREGVSPRLRDVAKNEEDLSFFEGQLDQSNLLGIGGGKQNPALQKIFGDIQNMYVGDMNQDTFKKAFEVYKPEQYSGLNVDDTLAKNLMDEVVRVQGFPAGKVVIRHPTALTDLFPETNAKGSASSKRLYRARQFEQQYNPDKTKFESVDDMKEFIATRFLVDDTVVRVDGKPMTKADQARVKAVGMGDTYKTKESGNARIEQYYKYKDMVAKGKKLSKTQQKIYDDLKARIDANKDKVTIKEDGRAYFNSSHRSAAKGLGGVGDFHVVDMDGNITTMIADENDLFGMAVPGDKRVLSITPPATYNVFRQTGKSTPDTAGSQKKKDWAQRIEQEYGAQARGTSRDAMREQMREAILSVNPAVRARDLKVPATSIGLATGVAAAPSLREDE